MELVLQVIADSGFDEGQLGKVNSARQAGADTSINNVTPAVRMEKRKAQRLRCSRTTCKDISDLIKKKKWARVFI